MEIQALYQLLRKATPAYTGSYSALYRYVRKLEPERPKVTVRVETGPGEEAQVDFGEVAGMYDPVRQRVRRTWAFVLTLSYSRHQYVEFVFDQTSTTWLQLHANELAALGGVPRKIKLDNLKAGVIHPSLEDPDVHRAYLGCATYYG